MMKQFFGKYRGIVKNNEDPLGLGRIQPIVPAISDMPLNWAMPCVPYAGDKVGFFAVPAAKANVWIEFEGGDPNYPIWTGCFWSKKEQLPPDSASKPTNKVWQTEKVTLWVDDEKTALTAKMKTDKGEMSLVMDAKGIVLTADKVTVSVAPDKVEIKNKQSTVTVADSIELKKAAASVAISNSIALKNGGASAEIASANITLKNGASQIAMSPATVNVNNGALEVM